MAAAVQQMESVVDGEKFVHGSHGIQFDYRLLASTSNEEINARCWETYTIAPIQPNVCNHVQCCSSPICEYLQDPPVEPIINVSTIQGMNQSINFRLLAVYPGYLSANSVGLYVLLLLQKVMSFYLMYAVKRHVEKVTVVQRCS